MTAVLGITGLDAVEHLGSDGFVTTYRAYDTQLAQKVIVEVLPPVSGNEAALQPFEQALRALYVKPRHPAILPIHELGQLEDGRPYVITLRSTNRVDAGGEIGSVGNSGNARGTACHLHFGISPPCPRPEWRLRRGTSYPQPFLDSWRKGGSASPAVVIQSWAASNRTECAAAAELPDAPQS